MITTKAQRHQEELEGKSKNWKQRGFSLGVFYLSFFFVPWCLGGKSSALVLKTCDE
jgi:hypothetical protein